MIGNWPTVWRVYTSYLIWDGIGIFGAYHIIGLSRIVPEYNLVKVISSGAPTLYPAPKNSYPPGMKHPYRYTDRSDVGEDSKA